MKTTGSICCERNQTKLRKKKEETPGIICVGCETRFPLWDEMEQCFASPEIQQRVRDRQEESAIEPGNQSKERALVGEVISTVALAGGHWLSTSIGLKTWPLQCRC